MGILPDKYTMFIATLKPRILLEYIKAALVSLGCECEVDGTHFQVKATLFDEAECVHIPFHVNVFKSRSPSHSSEQEYAVEFQRRSSGGTLEFLQLYAKFIQ